jgi:ubiquinone/menaquinone biosynthesis C-methylase UbiE
MSTLSSSQRFWNRKARENPYWYVSTFGDYSRPNLQSFWASGVAIWEEIKTRTGYKPGGGDTVVEIGCGIGRLTRAIAREVGAVHAFDISQEMIERASDGAPGNARFHWTSGNSLDPVMTVSADFVLAYLVFQHLPSERVYAEYLREMERVAKPGGRIAFTTSPRDWRVFALPFLRAKAYLAKALQRRGPSELYKREWTGIRPSQRRTQRLCPIPVAISVLPNERWLYWGTKGRALDCSENEPPLPAF